MNNANQLFEMIGRTFVYSISTKITRLLLGYRILLFSNHTQAVYCSNAHFEPGSVYHVWVLGPFSFRLYLLTFGLLLQCIIFFFTSMLMTHKSICFPSSFYDTVGIITISYLINSNFFSSLLKINLEKTKIFLVDSLSL